MKSISKRYSDIFNKYYIETAKHRFVFLINFIDSWMSKINIGNEFVYFVDHERLSKAIDSYFLDVIKFKEYHFDTENADVYSEAWCKEIHENKRINDSKVAAFTAKWLLKASPISIIPRDFASTILRPENDDVCHINEHFALDCALYALLREDFIKIDRDSYTSLFYDFKYRNFDERAYFSRFSLLLKLIEKNSLEDSISEESDKERQDVKVSKKEIKIFVASADDVKNLRQATEETISHLNSVPSSKVDFVLWRWERDKKPGYLEDDTQYQDQVFQEFGKHCDIFIILFWAKLGKGTVKEYEYFKNKFRPDNPKIQFWACEYGKSLKHEQAASAAELDAWLKQENSHWSPIGQERKSIKTVAKYKECLSKHLLEIALQD